ncbi:putative thiosulfate sulfurtransferase mpst-1 [Aphelenchoides bicaudatus]|nr:putative thiosulfate sulfurtransferase mpst-1 [Aphelenchoides bicaudatus]
MSLPKIVSTKALHAALKEVPKLRVIDCTYAVTPKPDYKEFKDNWFGRFEELRKRPSEHKTEFLKEHVPGSVHFDLDVGQYPGKYEKFSLYKPEIFEKYAQILGINGDEHLAFIGRGPFSGMLFPARCYMLFKCYGLNKLSLVDGGFADWKRNGFEIESTKGNDYPEVPRGNFKAKDEIAKNMISFEEFNKEGGILDNKDLANVFDNRVRPQFEGKQDTGLNPQYVTGTRIPNTTNVPSIEFLKFYKDYKPDKPTITFCNAGIQASLAAIVQQEIFPDAQIRVYNGSMKEMEIRAPKRISEGPQHIK